MAVYNENLLVSAASISADLNAVSVIAKNMSIGVKNAKAIAARAGDRARGFQPITDFINEMAIDIMKLVNLINDEALAVTRTASDHARTKETRQRMASVMAMGEQVRYIDNLRQALRGIESKVEFERNLLKNHARRLAGLLDEIERKVKAAQVISNTSRVEASRAVEYRQSLEVVAENLEGATDSIKKRVLKCKNRLSMVLAEVK